MFKFGSIIELVIFLLNHYETLQNKMPLPDK